MNISFRIITNKNIDDTKQIAPLFLNFRTRSSIGEYLSNTGMTLGYCETEMMLPLATSRIVTPSSMNSNLSFRIIGAKIAPKTIVMHDVDEIRIMLPSASANAFKH